MNGNGVIRVLVPILASIVVMMSANYFLFLQAMVNEKDLDKALLPITRELAEHRQDLKRLVAEENRRGGLVDEIPTLRQATSEIKGIQTELQGLRQALRDMRQQLAGITGKFAIPLEE